MLLLAVVRPAASAAGHVRSISHARPGGGVTRGGHAGDGAPAHVLGPGQSEARAAFSTAAATVVVTSGLNTLGTM